MVLGRLPGSARIEAGTIEIVILRNDMRIVACNLHSIVWPALASFCCEASSVTCVYVSFSGESCQAFC